ncbi:monooxygenase [Aestuariivirga sp.]|uniref:monooxygenase n=1 Tax=Aestuariivirga sp. TaxID=2650926 RepID=UPI003BAC8222
MSDFPINPISVQWGTGPTRRFASLAARFRPSFSRIAEGAVEREVTRTLPFEQIGWLKELRFGALRLPEQDGGYGATLEEFFELLAELAAADSNLAQILRAHFGFVEDLVGSPDPARRALWNPRIAKGDLLGGAFTERGTKAGIFATSIVPDGDGWLANGRKYYSTGSLFADWIELVGTGPDQKVVIAAVPTSAAGLTQEDDWDGFGQRLTGSGTSIYENVRLPADAVQPAEGRFQYQAAFYQTVHLATLTGIARAAAVDVSERLARRTRTFTHATNRIPRQDAQLLQTIGQVHAAAYAAGAITQRVAQALQRAYEAAQGTDGEVLRQANLAAEIEAAEGQVSLLPLVLRATTDLFDALAASATSRKDALDRHWRNARTISSHNPAVYKARVIGDFAVNRTEPPYMWLPGES